MNTAIVILAAGNSSRMGKPKQLLKFNGQTLLDLVINETLKTNFRPVIVVLGAYEEEIKKTQSHAGAIYVVNKDWEDGMSSSISSGLNSALKIDSEIENVIITVADQAYISSQIFEDLVRKHHQVNKNIIASAYLDTAGTPALFNKKYFKELMTLKGTDGAKKIIKRNIDDATTIPFELGRVDIDTQQDYKDLINNINKQ